jgi:hypothetical protein
MIYRFDEEEIPTREIALDSMTADGLQLSQPLSHAALERTSSSRKPAFRGKVLVSSAALVATSGGSSFRPSVSPVGSPGADRRGYLRAPEKTQPASRSEDRSVAPRPP